MFFRKTIAKLKAEIQYLRELVARLEGERDKLQLGYDGMKDIAARAIEAVKEKPRYAESQEFGDINAVDPRQWSGGKADRVTPNPDDYFPNYIAPLVKFCPECNVSVRSDDWPQECPGCHCVFGFNETNG